MPDQDQERTGVHTETNTDRLWMHLVSEHGLVAPLTDEIDGLVELHRGVHTPPHRPGHSRVQHGWSRHRVLKTLRPTPEDTADRYRSKADQLLLHMASEHDHVASAGAGFTQLYDEHRRLHMDKPVVHYYKSRNWDVVKVFGTLERAKQRHAVSDEQRAAITRLTNPLVNERTGEHAGMSEQSSLRELVAQGRMAEQILDERYPAAGQTERYLGAVAEQQQGLSPEQEREKWPEPKPDPSVPPQWTMIDLEEQAQPAASAKSEQKFRDALLAVRRIGARSGTNLNAWNEAFDVIDAALAPPVATPEAADEQLHCSAWVRDVKIEKGVITLSLSVHPSRQWAEGSES